MAPPFVGTPGKIIYYNQDEIPSKTKQAELKSGFGFIESEYSSFLDPRYTTILGDNLYKIADSGDEKKFTEITKSNANLTQNLFKPSNSVRSFFNTEEGSAKIVNH